MIDTGSKWIRNSASRAGGAVSCADTASLSFTGSEMTANSAIYEDGGAINSGCVRMNIIGSQFVSNEAARTAGAVSVPSSPPFITSGSIIGCSFIGNTAINGGAVAISASQNVTVSDSNFSENYGSAVGGGLVILIDAPHRSVVLKSLTFNQNGATNGGTYPHTRLPRYWFFRLVSACLHLH